MSCTQRSPARSSSGLAASLAASTQAVYAVWTDGRNNSIGQTGLGETDIFTSVQNNP